MSDTIILNGISWDTENLAIEGKTHFTYKEAKTEASKLGKRLPTKSEFEALLQLHHVFDKEKHGMWFAKNQNDLKSDKSLFLPAAGFSHVSLDYISDVGENGCYWSDTSYLQTKSAYRLNFNKVNNGNMYMLDGKYSYTVRCVTDIKQNNMKQEEEKSFKVQIPEGYEIDKENSTFECIKFKKSKSEYPKSWEEAFEGKTINGYYITAALSQIQNYSLGKNIGKYNANVFKYQEQAESALAYAQLTQLMALPCFNGDWKPSWDNANDTKYSIAFYDNKLYINVSYTYQHFLTFKSKEKAIMFLGLYKDLINVFFQNV